MKFFFVILLCISSIQTSAQNRIMLTATVGQYAMGELKDLQKEIKSDLRQEGYPVKAIQKFPVSLQVEAAYLVPVDYLFLAGGYVNYATTNGRLHYSDYSGRVQLDENVKRVVVGAMVLKTIVNKWAFYGKLGFNYSMLKIESISEVYGAGKSVEDIHFYSLGFNLEPGMSWSYEMQRFEFHIFGGYELNVQDKTYLDNESEAYLQNEEGDPININWSGVRLSLGVTYKL